MKTEEQLKQKVKDLFYAGEFELVKLLCEGQNFYLSDIIDSMYFPQKILMYHNPKKDWRKPVDFVVSTHSKSAQNTAEKHSNNTIPDEYPNQFKKFEIVDTYHTNIGGGYKIKIKGGYIIKVDMSDMLDLLLYSTSNNGFFEGNYLFAMKYNKLVFVSYDNWKNSIILDAFNREIDKNK